MTSLIVLIITSKRSYMYVVLNLLLAFRCIWPSGLARGITRDLRAATGLVILLKLDSDRWLFSPCDLQIWWITPKNNRAPLLYYIKLCALFQIHQWIQTGFTVRKHSVRVKIDVFCPMWPRNLTDMALKNNKTPLPSYFKLCASFRSHWWIQTGVTVLKSPIWVKIDDFF